MTLADYEVENIPDGEYIVVLDATEGNVSDKGTVSLKTRFKVVEGELKGQMLFKDFYITEKTCEKFLPWQLGIMGIWKVVRDADDFEQGLEKAIDETAKIMKAGTKFIVTATTETTEYEGKEQVRTNVIIDSNLSDNDTEEKVETKDQDFGPEPSFDKEEEIPF